MPCWSAGGAHWAHVTVALAYDLRYQQIRPLMCNGGVSRQALILVAAARARYADYATGRHSRPTNDRLAALTGLSVRQVQRADEALRLLGVATELLRGRQRTRAERFASWRTGDRGRGWASVWALHDNAQLSRVINGMSSHPRSGPVRDKPCRSSVVTTRPGSPSGRRQRGARRRTIPDAGGLLLANRWISDQQSPPWARRHRSPAAWAHILAGPARHGWTARDVNQLITDWLGTGHRIPDRPHKPIGLLGAILAWHGADNLDDRPAALDIAREEAELRAARAELAERQVEREDHRLAREAGRAALGGPGHRAARQALVDAAERARDRRWEGPR